jgi:hypothetical protein
MKNKYGLSRHIPEEIKRIIRQNSKFACVVPNCRNAFFEYEHLNPEFHEALIHDPEKICLTCPTHNPRIEGKNGKANFSKDQLFKFYENIKSTKVGPEIRNNDFFYGFHSAPIIVIGKSKFIRIASIINIDGEDVFSFSLNQSSNPFEPEIKFSGTFKKANGDLLFKIINNDWISTTDHWDLITTNGEITIYDNNRSVVFHAQKYPKENTIVINQLELWYPPFHIYIENNELYVGRVSRDNSKKIYLNLNASIEGSKCGIFLGSKFLIEELNFYGLEISGNTGACLPMNGIFLAKGGGVMLVQEVKILTHGYIEDKSIRVVEKTSIPENANYFVRGFLEERKIEFPLWTEKEYWLNGQKLDAQPCSWGDLDSNGEQLFYLSRQEKEDLFLNPGFVCFYADDLLNTPLQDKVFEIEVETTDPKGFKYSKRIKRCERKDELITAEFNKNTKKYFHPQEFAGMSPWKKKDKK